MTINLELPRRPTLTPQITVFGVGGAGGNAVNNMIASSLEGVNFVAANTDSQALTDSKAEKRIQLGETITQGLGAGSYPEVGKAAAEESMDQILENLEGSNMVFVTAGLGGGTGTGAAPVIARLAREQGVLTVGVVTKPFHFEGSHRMRVAELGLQELEKYVDTLIVIPNQNLFRVADKSTTFAQAFTLADEVLHSGVRGITDLMVMPGLINLDFADVRAVMSEMGKAMMGTGEGSSDNRAIEAAEAAISNPLLDNVSMKGARGVLINITGGRDMTLFEVDAAANRIREEVDPDANIIFGSTFSDNLEGVVRVSVVATGIDMQSAAQPESASTSYRISRPVEKEENKFVEENASTVEFAATGFGFSAPAAQEPEVPRKDDVFIAPEPEEPKQQSPRPQPSLSAAPRPRPSAPVQQQQTIPSKPEVKAEQPKIQPELQKEAEAKKPLQQQEEEPAPVAPRSRLFSLFGGGNKKPQTETAVQQERQAPPSLGKKPEQPDLQAEESGNVPPAFVRPQPKPMQQSVQPQQQAAAAKSPSASQQPVAQPQPQAPQPQNRLEVELEMVEVAAPAPAKPAASTSIEEDLDIPAFLRRRSN